MPDVEKSEKSIFCEAAELSIEQRPAFLDSACGDDRELRAGIEALLVEHDQSQSVLDVSPIGQTVDMPGDEQPGLLVGPYKLLQQIGEGGMGLVYMAEQTDPVKRRVALKVIKPGMDSRQIIARFEVERQALAMMDHPNVARVFDAGTTEQGRPYFAMELVKGIPITTYCDDNHVSTRDRLELFILVCEAVQHAHHKGIIHRDLKPSNVLVAEYDDRPVPKIIDFGVAKALNQSLTDKTMFTQFGQVVGTLEYMSPEQSKFNQLDVDTRSDVYSLGVLLYELLTGTTPIDKERLRSTGFDEVLRIIGEEEPPKPSTRLAMSDTLPAVAAGRGTDARHLPGLVRGDLDWIVMKALSKDRTDRYQTASALADDVRRHLEDRPIEARRPSLLGRLRRFVRRNRVPVALGSAAVLAICAAVAFGIYAADQRQRRFEQQQQQQIAEQNRLIKDQQREIEDAIRARIDRARNQFPEIRELIDVGLVVAAYRQAFEIRADLPEDDPEFGELWEELTRPLTLETDPPGALVTVRDWNDPGGEWLVLGETPLEDARVPRGAVRWKFELPGYMTRQMVNRFSISDRVKLRLFDPIPNCEGMVVVRRTYGVIKNTGYLPVEDGFLMDRYEVTNRQFQDFVDAGGYDNPGYWKHEFVNSDGEVIAHEDAMTTFVDRTGEHGPSTWSHGRFAPGTEDYPVHGVSWYEAAAYAEFAGKSLPTVHHWYAATYAPLSAKYVLPHSNFSDGPAPVGSHDGIGVYNIYDLAGNVAEWCYNESSAGPGIRCLRGGAWNDPDYMYIAQDLGHAMDRLPRHGFRCVAHRADHPPSEESLEPVSQRAPTFDKPPVSDEVMNVILSRFDVSPEQSLNDRVISTEDHGSYRHDTVQIDAAYGQERFNVHLYFPKNAKPPYETVVWIPGSGAFSSNTFEGRRDQSEVRFQDELLASGRAVCLPVCQGMYGRKPGNTSRLDAHIQGVRDVRRAVDYLWSKPDQFDRQRLIYGGFSFGASSGPIFCVAEKRIAVAVLINGGYTSWGRQYPEMDAYNFTGRMRIPVLMINGRFDAIFPVREAQEPFFKDLGSPEEDKELIHFDGGHGIPGKAAVEKMDRWLKSKLPPRE